MRGTIGTAITISFQKQWPLVSKSNGHKERSRSTVWPPSGLRNTIFWQTHSSMPLPQGTLNLLRISWKTTYICSSKAMQSQACSDGFHDRSEERRVGKECRS